MHEFLLAVVVFFLVLLLAGMLRILRGPHRSDRMMAAQLFGTQATAILLILALVLEAPAIVDVALVLALLAVVATVAFVQRAPGEDAHDR